MSDAPPGTVTAEPEQSLTGECAELCLASLVRAYRHRHRLSLQAFGKKCGVGPQCVVGWEQGKRFPRRKVMQSLASVLGLTPGAVEQLVAAHQQDEAARKLPIDGRRLGGLIAAHRKKHGLNCAQLAEQCRVTTAALRNWECDLYFPSPQVVPRLGQVLGLSAQAIERMRPPSRAEIGLSATIAKQRTGAKPVDKTSLPSLITEYRRTHRLTRTQFGARCGVSRRSVGNWEEGTYFPAWDVLLCVVETLGLTPDDTARLAGVPRTGAVAKLLDLSLSPTPRPEGQKRREMSLPDLILAYCHQHDMSHAELAAHCGVTQGTVSNWAMGKHFPKGAALFRLGEAIGLPADAIEWFNSNRFERKPIRLARRMGDSPLPTESLATLVRDHRHQHELTQVEFAKRCGVAHTMVKGWERGAIPRPCNLPRLAKALGLTTEQIKDLTLPDWRDAAAAIMSALADGQPHGVAFIGRRVKIANLGQRLAELARQGVLHRVSQGVYQLAHARAGHLS